MEGSYLLRCLNESDLIRDKWLLEEEVFEYTLWSSKLVEFGESASWNVEVRVRLVNGNSEGSSRSSDATPSGRKSFFGSR
jgi:hypothetical protein